MSVTKWKKFGRLCGPQKLETSHVCSFQKENSRPTPVSHRQQQKRTRISCTNKTNLLRPRVCGTLQSQHDASLDYLVMRLSVPSFSKTERGVAEEFSKRLTKPQSIFSLTAADVEHNSDKKTYSACTICSVLQSLEINQATI